MEDIRAKFKNIRKELKKEIYHGTEQVQKVVTDNIESHDFISTMIGYNDFAIERTNKVYKKFCDEFEIYYKPIKSKKIKY